MQSLMLLNICLIIASAAVIFLGRTLRAKEEAAADFKDEEPASAKVLRKFISSCVWVLLGVNLLSLIWLFASGTVAPPGTAPQVEATIQTQPADKAAAPASPQALPVPSAPATVPTASPTAAPGSPTATPAAPTPLPSTPAPSSSSAAPGPASSSSSADPSSHKLHE